MGCSAMADGQGLSTERHHRRQLQRLAWLVLGGVLGTSIALVALIRAVLRERRYSAVMAATGLLYLAILTAFGMDLVARATLA